MALDPKLLEILACPEDSGRPALLRVRAVPVQPRLRRRYEVRDDIPVRCSSRRPRPIDDAEHDRLMAKAEADGIRSTLEG